MRALKKYLKKRENTINFLLETQQQSYIPDTFHTLRVEIKRLNALFNLANYYSKRFKKKKTSKPFKRIFRQAGKVRELQVEESLLEEYFAFNLLPEYKGHLEKLLTRELEVFFLITNNGLFQTLKKSIAKLLPCSPRQVKKKRSVIWIKKELKFKSYLIKMP